MCCWVHLRYVLVQLNEKVWHTSATSVKNVTGTLNYDMQLSVKHRCEWVMAEFHLAASATMSWYFPFLAVGHGASVIVFSNSYGFPAVTVKNGCLKKVLV